MIVQTRNWRRKVKSSALTVLQVLLILAWQSVSYAGEPLTVNEPNSIDIEAIHRAESKIIGASLDTIAEYLKNGDRHVSFIAAYELVRRKDEDVKQIILRNIDGVNYDKAKLMLASKLHDMGSMEAYQYFTELMSSENETVKYSAAVYVTEQDQEALPYVEKGINSPDKSVARLISLKAMRHGVIPERMRVDAFKVYVNMALSYREIIAAFEYLPRAELLEYVLPYTANEHDEVTRTRTLSAISRMEEKSIKMPIFMEHLDDPSPRIVSSTVRIIANMEDRSEWKLSRWKSEEARIPEICQQIKQWWAEESAKAQKPQAGN